jgi:integrase
MIQLLTVADVAWQLRVSPQWVRDHCGRRRPLLPVIRLGGVLRFDAEQLRDFLKCPHTNTLEEESVLARNDEKSDRGAGGRPRGQEGHVEKVGEKVKKWQIHWFVYELDKDGKEVRKHRSRVIGRCPGGPVGLSIADALLPEMSKHEAQRELRKVIDRETGIVRGGSTARASSSVTFGWFARNRWLPMREATWRPSTKATNMQVLNGYIFPAWEAVPLRDLDTVAVAKWLNKMAESFSQTIVHKCRTYMKAIVAEAVDQEYLQRDTLRKLAMPQMDGPARPTITPEQIRAVIAEIESFRDQVIFLTLILTGMRPSEVFALQWRDWNKNSLLVERGVVQGKVNKTKTRMSRGRVAIPAHLGDLLEAWRIASELNEGENWIFPSERNTPLRLDNWVKRYLKPAADRAGVKVTAQMLRRSFATIAHEAGVSMKAVQGQLRHSSINMTSNVYTQVPEGSQDSLVEVVAKKIVNGSGNKKD